MELILIAALSGHAATYRDSAWTRTVYYQCAINVKGSKGKIRIAAVDSCEVYFNGELLGSNPDWREVREFSFDMKRKGNFVGVKVVNLGRGNGSGLVAEVEVDGEIYPSGLDRRYVVWRWSSSPGEDWLKKDVSKDPNWHPVQLGDMRLADVRGLVDPRTRPVAGYPGGTDQGGGTLVLKRLDGENLALGQRAYDDHGSDIPITDGVVRLKSKSWQAPDPNVLNESLYIDLIERRKIDKVRVITYGKEPQDFRTNSLRGYSVLISEDNSSWTEVAVLHGIEDYEETEVSFAPIYARYVRLLINESDNINSPVVAEVEVYGPGYAPEGTFTSQVLDLGTDLPKNFGRVRWKAEVPEGASISLQFRAGDEPDTSDASWTGWSEEYFRPGEFFQLPEPKRYIQYRVHLKLGRTTPSLRWVEVDYDRDIPATSALAEVSPNRVVMGEPTWFDYKMRLVPTDLGIKRIAISTPSMADSVEMNIHGRWRSKPDSLILEFDEPITQANCPDTLKVRFKATLYGATHEFRSFLFSEGSENPLNVAQGRSWKVVVTDVMRRILELKTKHAAFSPNDDNQNDVAHIEFVLAKVEDVKVETEILDINGASLKSWSTRLSAGEHFLEWDGRDREGKLVPPGLYIYRIEVEVGEGDSEVASGTLAVVY